MKTIIFCLLLIFISNAHADKKLIGGFGAPIFFTQYDQTQIDAINQLKNVRQVKITYPSNLYKLARQIAKNIKLPGNPSLKLDETDLQDTATVKYRHDAVVVILYFSSTS